MPVEVLLCFIQDQPNITSVAWSQCLCTWSSICIPPPSTLASRSLPYASFETSQMYLQWLGPGSEITQWTVRLLFWAYSCLELSTFLVSQNTNSCFNTISHFSSTKKQQPDSKDTKNENEKCFQMMMKTVNSVLRCNMNHHTMIFPCLILLGLLERTLPYFYNCCAKGDKFHTQSFVCCMNCASVVWNLYFN